MLSLPDGKEVDAMIRPDNTVDDIKKCVEKMTEIGQKHLRVLFFGEEEYGTTTPGSKGLKEGSKITVLEKRHSSRDSKPIAKYGD